MRFLPFVSVFILAAAVPVLATQSPAPPSLTIVLSGQSVIASGASPNARVVYFGIVRDFVSHSPRTRRILTEVIADASGKATLRLEKNAPPQSFFVAVSVADGAFGVGLPEGGVAQPFKDLPDVVKNAGQARKIVTHRAVVDVLFVRPGEGAWSMRTGDGFATDEDKKNNGLLTASLDDLTATEGQAPAPHTIRKGDVLVLLDGATFEYVVSSIGGN